MRSDDENISCTMPKDSKISDSAHIQLDTLNILLHAQQLVPKLFVNHAHKSGIAVHFIEHLQSEEDKYEGF